jgi:AcrR family transcriptional regulator
MPTPDRTSLDDIVRAARDLLESSGPAGVSMQAVAERVGVRAPSLYKRVRNRDDLIRLAAEATLGDLQARLDAVSRAGDARRRLRAIAHALRDFAKERPAGYRLVFSPPSEAARLSPETLARSSDALLEIAADLAGPQQALEAARTVTAWATGFIAMELAGAFRLGGDVDAAFEYGIARLSAALVANPADG